MYFSWDFHLATDNQTLSILTENELRKQKSTEMSQST